MCNYTLNGLYRRVLFAVGNLVAVPVSGKKLYLCRVKPHHPIYFARGVLKKVKMKKVITYGTFDLLHQGHINLLRRAKELGDYLIVGVTTEKYDRDRGKLNVSQSCLERIESVKQTGYADEIIIEEYEGQKIDDIQRLGVDIFAIGSDWTGKFDYLKEYCQVVYLERTKGISSTQLRNEKQKLYNIGIIGSGRIANRFVPESKFVSGVNVLGVYNPNLSSAQLFCERHSLMFATDNLDEFLSRIDAVYIAAPHLMHYQYAKTCLLAGKHVLCEKPMTLSSKETQNLYDIAKQQKVTLLEAIKTAFCPGFNHLISLVKSGVIGSIKDVEATFTKLVTENTREMQAATAGGSITELSSYVLLPILKIFGNNYQSVHFYPIWNKGVDVFTKGLIEYPNGTATFKVGLGVKSEGELIISGTKGYAYVPAPWWKTDYFELRFEDMSQNKKYFYRFEGDGLRYEIEEFISMITEQRPTFRLTCQESLSIVEIIERFRNTFPM